MKTLIAVCVIICKLHMIYNLRDGDEKDGVDRKEGDNIKMKKRVPCKGSCEMVKSVLCV